MSVEYLIATLTLSGELLKSQYVIVFLCFLGGAILFLDNVDYPLEPGSTEHPNPVYMPFLAYLENITNLPNPRLKILMTSRLGLKKTALNPKVNEF